MLKFIQDLYLKTSKLRVIIAKEIGYAVQQGASAIITALSWILFT